MRVHACVRGWQADSRDVLWGQGRKASGQEWGRRTDGQRVRPSSKASREAAASSTPSVGSHPPLGTAGLRLQVCAKVRGGAVSTPFADLRRDLWDEMRGNTHRPSYLAVSGW